MQTTVLGTGITIKVPLIDDAGDPVTPTGLTYVVRDGDDQVIAGPTTIEDLSGTDKDIVVAADILSAVGPYVLVVKIITSQGTFNSVNAFGVVNETRLEYLKNSFVTYQQAAFIARDLPNTLGWDNATQDLQSQALIESFKRLTRLNYSIARHHHHQSQTGNEVATPPWHLCRHRLHFIDIAPSMWPHMTAEFMDKLPASFLTALRTAQVVEANVISKGDPIGDLRKAGLMSKTVGESSMMFRVGPAPLEFGVAKETMNCLSGFLNPRISLTRA